MATWADIQKRIFATESGGDYNALYGYQNRKGGLFDDVRITDMTVDDALDFTNPKGRYGAFVSTQTPDNRVATPIGAYQVVGSTLRDAKRGLGLKGDELMTPALQDRIGKWIYETQGAGAWEGLKGKGAMEPTGILGAMAGQQEEDTPFYKRDSFKDMIGNLAIGLNSMRLNPDENLPRVIQAQQAERKKKRETNRTLEWMRANGYGQYADMVESGQIPAKTMMSTLLAKRLEGPAKPIEVGGRLIDPNTYEVVYSPQEGPDFEVEQKLRKEFASLPAIDQLANQTTAYEKILKSAENPSPAGDLALVFNYMKVLDPSSVVRESEFKSAAMAGNFGQRIQAAVGNIEKGTLLTDDQRRDFIDRATRLYQGGVAQAQPFYDQYSQYAINYGIDPNRILTKYSYAGQMPELLPNVPREIPQAAIDAGLTQQDWDGLSVMGKSAFVEK